MCSNRYNKSPKPTKLSFSRRQRIDKQKGLIMHLNQIAAKPQLISVILDDEDTIKEFGEPLEFNTWDRQPLDIFLKLANRNQDDATGMIDIVRTLILDPEGKEIIKDGVTIPTTILMRVISKIVELLGK